MGTALLFIAATVVVNVLAKSLHFFQGKCEFMVFLGLFFVHVTYPVKDHDLLVDYHGVIAVVLAISLLITLMWTNVLVFDIFWTFRWVTIKILLFHRFFPFFRQKPTSACRWEKTLQELLLVRLRVCNWLDAITLTHVIHQLLVLSHLVPSDFAVLLWCHFSRQFSSSFDNGCEDLRALENIWYNRPSLVWSWKREVGSLAIHRKTRNLFYSARFWKYLVTFVIVYVLWSAELSTKLSSSIVPVFLISLSTFVMFVIFALDKASTLFKRYDEMDDDSTVA